MIWRLLSAMGRLLGGWNDRCFGRAGTWTERRQHPLWRPIDRIAGRLYVLGDRSPPPVR